MNSSTALTDTPHEVCRVLLQRLVQQDTLALAEFYDLTVSRVYGVAKRIVNRADLAEDVVNEVFQQVWRSAGSYDPQRGEVLAWLLTITRSRALDLLRRQDRAELHPDPQLLAEQADRTTPHDILAVAEANQALHARLENLTAEQRQLLALAFFKGLSHQEIAAHTQLPLGTVKTHLRRALATLRDDLVADARHWA